VNRAFRIIKLVFLVASALSCLAIPVAGVVSTAVGWEGICYGFTNSQWFCPWWEYALNEMFWASFIFVPLLFVASLTWLGMAAVQFIASRVGNKNAETNKAEPD
jgi:hypothetical protein